MVDFFSLRKISRFIFVDCDNVNYKKVATYLLKNNCVSPDCEVFCLIGGNKNQNNYSQELDKALESKKTVFSITKIRTQQTEKNATDFILTAYIGMAIWKNPEAQFTILSGLRSE